VSYLEERRTWIIGSLDVATKRGLEIGALNNPLISKNEGNVEYVDYGSTGVLRTQHASSATIKASDIVDVDYIWRDLPLVDCIQDFHPYDHVVAAHVIEHVPDLIGWLLDLHGVLKHGGLLGLAIPDRRHTFDFFRNESTVGEMLERP
jgi:2-polyprenyl-3-methyl-5-hydroxy-6-metoxy-1,4-benzoquinol methylase